LAQSARREYQALVRQEQAQQDRRRTSKKRAEETDVARTIRSFGFFVIRIICLGQASMGKIVSVKENVENRSFGFNICFFNVHYLSESNFSPERLVLKC
jgi:hypothetical protein